MRVVAGIIVAVLAVSHGIVAGIDNNHYYDVQSRAADRGGKFNEDEPMVFDAPFSYAVHLAHMASAILCVVRRPVLTTSRQPIKNLFVAARCLRKSCV